MTNIYTCTFNALYLQSLQILFTKMRMVKDKTVHLVLKKTINNKYGWVWRISCLLQKCVHLNVFSLSICFKTTLYHCITFSVILSDVTLKVQEVVSIKLWHIWDSYSCGNVAISRWWISLVVWEQSCWYRPDQICKSKQTITRRTALYANFRENFFSPDLNFKKIVIIFRLIYI